MAGGASCEDKAPGGNRTRAGGRPFEILLGGIMGLTPARALRGVVLSTIAVTSTLLVVTATAQRRGASGQAGEGDRPLGRGDQAGRGLRGRVHLERRQQRHQLPGQARRPGSAPRWTATPSPRPPGPPQTTRPAGTVVRVQVTPSAAPARGPPPRSPRRCRTRPRRPGRSASPGRSATATVTQDGALRRPVAAASIVRSIDWGEGGGFESWASGDHDAAHLPGHRRPLPPPGQARRPGRQHRHPDPARGGHR